MAQKWFIAVGGTGQHIALAIADQMVLEHLVTGTPLKKIQMLLFDADPDGPGEQKSAWQLTQEQFDALEATGNRLPMLRSHRPLPRAMDVHGAATAVANLALRQVLGSDDADMLLTKKQCEIELATGYYGEPRIAAAMTEQLLEEMKANTLAADHPLTDLQDALTDGKTRVAIGGSAVGGTGAGMIPQLVEALAQDGGSNRVCAVIGLPWFRLDSDSAIQQHEANAKACMWHYNQTMMSGESRYRLVLWGHPDLRNAEREKTEGLKQQAVKNDQSLPWAAAVSATAFLESGSVDETDEARTGHFAPVGTETTGKKAGLSPNLLLRQYNEAGAHSQVYFLQCLYVRNKRLIRMMEHLRAYLNDPPSLRAVHPFFGNREKLEIESLDNLTGENNFKLIEHIDRLIAAKRAALGRLELSNNKNDVDSFEKEVGDWGADEKFQGLKDLRALLVEPAIDYGTNGDNDDDDDDDQHEVTETNSYRQYLERLKYSTPIGRDYRLLDLNTIEPTARRNSNNVLVHNTSGDPVSAIGGKREGARCELGANTIDGLSPVSQVQAQRIPDLRGVEMLLEQVLDASADTMYGPGAQPRKLHEWLLDGDNPRKPNVVSHTGGDLCHQWAIRWFALVSALCMPDLLSVVPLESPIPGDEGKGAKNHDITHKLLWRERPIGYLNPSLIAVPSFDPFWNEQAGIDSLFNALGSFNGSLMLPGWIRTLKLVGECMYGLGSGPGWLDVLTQTLKVHLQVPSVINTGAQNRTTKIKWGTQEIRVALPSSGSEGGDLTSHMVDNFELPQRGLNEGEQLPAVQQNQDVREALTELTQLAVQYQTLPQSTLPSSDGNCGWKPTETRYAIWIDRGMGASTRDLISGGTFLIPGAEAALQLELNGMKANLLTAEDILTDNIVVYKNGSSLVKTIPIHGEHAGLLANETDATIERQENGDVKVALVLVGRTEPVTAKYYVDGDGTASRRRAINIHQDSSINLLTWPSHHWSTGANGPCYRTASVMLQRKNQLIWHRLLYGSRGPTQIDFGSGWVDGRRGMLSRIGQGPATTDRMYHYDPDIDENGASNGAPAAMPLYLELQAKNASHAAAIATDSDPTQDETAPVDLGLFPWGAKTVGLDQQQDTWCIDLGTSSTVVARCAGDNDNATVVGMAGHRDSTIAMVNTKPKLLPAANPIWFPTWDQDGPKGPESDASIMPSQVIVRHQDLASESPSELRFGRDWTFDPGKVHKNIDRSLVVSDLKWSTSTSGEYRRPFIRHLVELALSMEMAAYQRQRNPHMPSRHNKFVFTLPLSQRGPAARDFVREIEGAATDIKATTGLDINPHYQWESLAIAPRMMNDSGMFVIADLGGGTLDLFGAFYRSGEQAEHLSAESALLGGRHCIDMLSSVLGAKMDVDRRIRGKPLDQDVRNEWVDAVPEVGQYFELQYRYIVLWTHALRQKWGLPSDVPVKFTLAGLGWNLPGGPKEHGIASNRLTKAATSIGEERRSQGREIDGIDQLKFHPWGEDSGETNPVTRKTYLARRCTEVKSYNSTDIHNALGALDLIMGIPLVAASDAKPNFQSTSNLNEVDAELSGYTFTPGSAKDLTGRPKGLGEQAMAKAVDLLSTVKDRTNKRAAWSPDEGSLVSSPLTVLAEQALLQLQREVKNRV